MSPYLVSMVSTICIESMILWLFLRKEELLKILFYEILITCFTLPIAYYCYLNLIHSFVAVEAGVVFVESILIMALFELKYREAFVYSLAANTATAVLGLIINK